MLKTKVMLRHENIQVSRFKAKPKHLYSWLSHILKLFTENDSDSEIYLKWLFKKHTLLWTQMFYDAHFSWQV